MEIEVKEKGIEKDRCRERDKYMYIKVEREKERGNQLNHSALNNCSAIINSLAPLTRRLKLAPLTCRLKPDPFVGSEISRFAQKMTPLLSTRSSHNYYILYLPKNSRLPVHNITYYY